MTHPLPIKASWMLVIYVKCRENNAFLKVTFVPRNRTRLSTLTPRKATSL
jgi:hypothetical protein